MAIMKSLLIFVILIVAFAVGLYAAPEPTRPKRATMGLMDVMKCTMGNAYSFGGYMKIADHGCWCSMKSKANKPVDEVDQCCKVHEECLYSDEANNVCKGVDGTNFEAYDFTCNNKQSDGKGTPVCSVGPITNNCNKIICKCDTEFANCLNGRELKQKKC